MDTMIVMTLALILTPLDSFWIRIRTENQKNYQNRQNGNIANICKNSEENDQILKRLALAGFATRITNLLRKFVCCE